MFIYTFASKYSANISKLLLASSVTKENVKSCEMRADLYVDIAF